MPGSVVPLAMFHLKLWIGSDPRPLVSPRKKLKAPYTGKNQRRPYGRAAGFVLKNIPQRLFGSNFGLPNDTY